MRVRACSASALIARALALAASLTLVSCGEHHDQTPATTAAAPAATPPTATSATATSSKPWDPSALEELLAPIALYPDALLAQVLAAATTPQEVLDGGNWLLQNQSLTGDALDAAAEKNGFNPPMRALLHFPTVVDMMCQELDWTRQVGEAFTADQKSVLDAVQRLRKQAAQAGNLKSTPQQKVETKEDQNKQVVVIQPAQPQVVYVPQYNPQTVYAPPPAPQPTTTTQPGYSSSDMLATGLLAFGAGVLVTKMLDDNNPNYSYPHWGTGVVFVGPQPWHGYAYRPVYGPAFRPASGYVRPANYPYRYDHNTNVVINNNNNYFGRFQNNGNRRPGYQPPGLTNRAEPRVAERSTAQWKGQSNYAGAREGANRLDSAHATPNPSGRTREPQLPATRDSIGSNRVGQAAQRPQARSGADRPALDSQATARPNIARGDAEGSGALSGVGDGDTERAASARGRVSLAEARTNGAHRRR